MSDVEVDQLFQQGVAAVRAGDKAKARELLGKVVELDQVHEQAWLWLSAAVDSNGERVLCLQNVLTINPKSEAAIKGLQQLGAPVPDAARPPAVEDTSHSAADGAAISPAPPQPAPEEGWRKKLYEDASYTSDAVIVHAKDQPPPRDLNDLANAVLSALIFKIPGDYQEEVKYGPTGHIMINVGVAVLLQVLAVIVPMAIFLATNRSPSYLVQPIMQSSQQISHAVSQVTPASMAPALLRPALQYLLPASSGGIQTPVVTPALIASFGTLLLFYLVGAILATFAILLFQSLVVNRVAMALRGSGDVFQTTLALSVAMVATQVVQLPVFLLVPVLPFGVLATLLLAVRLYEFLQTSTAVNAAHRLGILVSMGAVIMSDIVMVIAMPCLLFCVSFLIGRIAGAG